MMDAVRGIKRLLSWCLMSSSNREKKPLSHLMEEATMMYGATLSEGFSFQQPDINVNVCPSYCNRWISRKINQEQSRYSSFAKIQNSS